MTRDEAHKLVDSIFDAAGATEPADEIVAEEVAEEQPKDERVLPEGKRAVRTKSSGDRVFLLDDEKKTRQWVTNADILLAIGFEMGDVVEVDDKEMLKYQMGPAIYRAPEQSNA